jgi:hypothetical protein
VLEDFAVARRGDDRHPGVASRGFLKQFQRRHHLLDEQEMLISCPQFNIIRHR